MIELRNVTKRYDDNTAVDVYTDAQGFKVRIFVAPRDPEKIVLFISLAMRIVKLYLRASAECARNRQDTSLEPSAG